MSLDPQAAWLLETLKITGRPALNHLTPAAARAQYAELVRRVEAKPAPIGEVEDGCLPGPDGNLGFRVYRPSGSTRAPAPALLFFHGGGYVVGSLETHDSLCRLLAAKAQIAVVSLDYRLAPERKFPAAVEDAWTAFRWLVSASAALGFDPQRIAVGGDGAGGGLAAAVSAVARDAGGITPAFQLLCYPSLDMYRQSESRRALADGYLMTESVIAWFADHYAPPEERRDPRASPLLATDFSGLPPTLIVTGGYDPLRDEGRAYGDALRQAGVNVFDRHYPGMIHGFLTMSGVLDEAKWAIDNAATILFEALIAKFAR